MHDKDQYSGICNNYKADSHFVVYCQFTFPCHTFKLGEGKKKIKESITREHSYFVGDVDNLETKAGLFKDLSVVATLLKMIDLRIWLLWSPRGHGSHLL